MPGENRGQGENSQKLWHFLTPGLYPLTSTEWSNP